MSISAILFDLEGTLLRAKTFEVLPGACEIVDYCRQRKLPFAIVSNNTVESPERLVVILKERGFAVDDADLLTPLKLLSRELTGLERALVIGSRNLEEFIEESGVQVCRNGPVDIVILGGGYTISNELLYAATDTLLSDRARFVCLHRNRICNDAAGVARPDVGCIVTGIEFSTGITAKTLGKPSAEYFSEAIRSWGIHPSKILCISDDPISDLGGAKEFGFQTGFVHTGKYGAETELPFTSAPDRSWASLAVALADISGTAGR